MGKFTVIMSIIAGVVSTSGCFPQKPYTTTGNTDWTSPLDADLRAAVATLADELKAGGYPDVEVMWVGARGRDYAIDRNALGAPVAKYAQVAYAFKLAGGKCYLDSDFSTLTSGPKLVRANDGGGYGAPQIKGWAPPKGGFGGRHEITCDAVQQAKGGVHEPFAQ